MTDETRRVCRKCGEEQSLTAFPRNKNAPGGIDKMCKTCWKNRPKKNSSQLITAPKARIQKAKKNSQSEPVVDNGIIPDDVQIINIGKLSQLPSGEKLANGLRAPGPRVYEHHGILSEGLKRFHALYGIHAKTAYSFKVNRYFLTV